MVVSFLVFMILVFYLPARIMKTSITANENAIKLPYKHHVFPAMTFFGEP